MSVRSIPFDVLTDDFFVNEMKPNAKDEAGRLIYAPSKAIPTIEIIKAQVLPVIDATKNQDWDGAVAHALYVCDQMSGLRAAGEARASMIKHIKKKAQNSHLTFEAAVINVIENVHKEGHRQFRSAATKMLQLFPQSANDSAIYDSLVRQAIVKFQLAKNEAALQDIKVYLAARKELAKKPLIKTDAGTVITIDEYIALPKIQEYLAQHDWPTTYNLSGFVRSRLLDRALWLLAEFSNK